MGLRVTSTWLMGLTRHPALMQRFPFLLSLKNNWQVQSNCGGCGHKQIRREISNQANEAAKILATIPESEIQEFKRMVNTDSLTIAYMDIGGRKQQTIR